MLTSKERSELRAQANGIETTLIVGKDGVSEAVIAEAVNGTQTSEAKPSEELDGADNA